MLGFSEKEVGHFTLKKWVSLYAEYRKYHNFKAKGYIFREENFNENQNPNGWLPF
jgi:hypothetical protein